MTANRTLIAHKCAGVIKTYAEFAEISLRQAFDEFYKSNLYIEIINGISDMHCRSDGYLAEELQIEMKKKQTSATLY
jgi:hypothetical protein